MNTSWNCGSSRMRSTIASSSSRGRSRSLAARLLKWVKAQLRLWGTLFRLTTYVTTHFRLRSGAAHAYVPQSKLSSPAIARAAAFDPSGLAPSRELRAKNVLGPLRPAYPQPERAGQWLAFDGEGEEGTATTLVNDPARDGKQRFVVVWQTQRPTVGQLTAVERLRQQPTPLRCVRGEQFRRGESRRIACDRKPVHGCSLARRDRERAPQENGHRKAQDRVGGAPSASEASSTTATQASW